MASVVLKSLPVVTVAAAGTRVPFSATPIDKVVAVYVSAPAANTGNMYIGGLTTLASTKVGMEIAKATSAVKLEYSGDGNYIDIQNMYADALNSGDSVTVCYLQVVS